MTSQNDEYTLLLDHHNLRLLCKVCFPLSLVDAKGKKLFNPGIVSRLQARIIIVV